MALQAFYQTVAQLCFTLLGLWWLVLQTKYSEWIGNPERRRMITNISLYFLLPGTMSLLALLSPQAHYLWQVAFVLAGGLGAFETAALIRHERRHKVESWLALSRGRISSSRAPTPAAKCRSPATTSAPRQRVVCLSHAGPAGAASCADERMKAPRKPAGWHLSDRWRCGRALLARASAPEG